MIATQERENIQESANKTAFSKTTRCDQCGAQAYVRAHKPEQADNDASGLFFCIHHAKSNEAGLIAQGFDIDDRSWALK